MNIESQVANLELSKQLKELNVNQKTYAEWLYISADNLWMVYPQFENTLGYAAYTTSELLELLPHRITTKENEPYNSYRLRMEKGIWCKENIDVSFSNINLTEYYSVNYISDTTSQGLDWLFPKLTKNMNDENPANALAKMLIYLYEEELINVMA